jgi:hypothetical protein
MRQTKERLMRLYLAAALLLVPVAAVAQQAPQQAPTPVVQALQQTVIKLTGEELEWQARAIGDEAEIADLKKQVAAAKPATPEPKKP